MKGLSLRRKQMNTILNYYQISNRIVEYVYAADGCKIRWNTVKLA